jgi:hypothetical protein
MLTRGAGTPPAPTPAATPVATPAQAALPRVDSAARDTVHRDPVQPVVDQGSTGRRTPDKLKPVRHDSIIARPAPTEPDPSAELGRLRTMLDGKHPENAGRALDLANSVIPRLPNRAERAEAKFLKAQALGELKKQDEACSVLRDMKEQGDAVGTTWQVALDNALPACPQ